ncbi:MAG TPA: DUF58 domain-containing protein [Planktothrix sp.]|jgi:uncharacterized protein (DUF58 family)
MDIADQILDTLVGLEQVGIQVAWRTSAPHYTGSERDSNMTGETGFDLAGMKEWEPGDRLDTRTTGRTGWRTRYTRVYEQPRELTVYAIVEDSQSVQYGMVNQTKKQLAAKLMASVLLNATALNDLSGYAVWSGEHLQRFRKPAPAGHTLYAALSFYLDSERENDELQPSEISGLGQALTRLPADRRCLVFVISDCLAWSESDRDALDQAASQHDIVFLVVGDLRERELPDEGFGFRDIEDIQTGKKVSVFLSAEARRRWQEDFDRRREEMRKRLENFGISMEEFFTDQTVDELNEKIVPVLAGQRST